MQPGDLRGDEARLFEIVGEGLEGDLLPGGVVRPEGFALAADVAGDHLAGGLEDGRRRAVVLLEADDGAVGIIAVEAEDIADLRAPPAVDRLVVVAHHAQVAMDPGEQVHQPVLDLVGVLEFVDQQVPEAAAVLLEDRFVGFEEAHGVEEQIAEIEGVGLLEPLLVAFVDPRRQLAVIVAPIDGLGELTPVLGVVDGDGGRPWLEDPLGDVEFAAAPP